MKFDRHLFGSRSGYETLARSAGLREDESRELSALGFGQSSSPAFIESLGDDPCVLCRPLRSSQRMAITRVFEGPVDDAGRLTLQLRTVVFDRYDFDKARRKIRELIQDPLVWGQSEFEEGTSGTWSVSKGGCKPTDEAWHIADYAMELQSRTDLVLRIPEGPEGSEAILNLVASVHVEDALTLRWGLRLLSTGAAADVCTLVPSAVLVPARRVVDVPLRGGFKHQILDRTDVRHDRHGMSPFREMRTPGWDPAGYSLASEGVKDLPPARSWTPRSHRPDQSSDAGWKRVAILAMCVLLVMSVGGVVLLVVPPGGRPVPADAEPGTPPADATRGAGLGDNGTGGNSPPESAEPVVGDTSGPGRKSPSKGVGSIDPDGGAPGFGRAGESEGDGDGGQHMASTESEPEPESPSSTEASEGGKSEGQTAAATTEDIPSKSPTPTRADLLRASREGIKEVLASERESQPVTPWGGELPNELVEKIDALQKELGKIEAKLRSLKQAATFGALNDNTGTVGGNGSSPTGTQRRALENTTALFQEVDDLLEGTKLLVSAQELRRLLDESGIYVANDDDRRITFGVDPRWFAWRSQIGTLFEDYLEFQPADPKNVLEAIRIEYSSNEKLDWVGTEERLTQAIQVFATLQSLARKTKVLQLRVASLSGSDEKDETTKALLLLEQLFWSTRTDKGEPVPGPGRKLRSTRENLHRRLQEILRKLAVTPEGNGLRLLCDAGVPTEEDGSNPLGSQLHEPGSQARAAMPSRLLERSREIVRQILAERRSATPPSPDDASSSEPQP